MEAVDRSKSLVCEVAFSMIKDDIEAIATDIAGEANKAVRMEGLRDREKRGEGKKAWK
jgi:hypothetical protein